MSKCFLAKSPVGSLPLANLEMAHGACHFLTERGLYRARRWIAVRWNIGGKTEGVKYRAPAQMRSRCEGRGAARVLPSETVAARRADGRSFP